MCDDDDYDDDGIIGCLFPNGMSFVVVVFVVVTAVIYGFNI